MESRSDWAELLIASKGFGVWAIAGAADNDANEIATNAIFIRAMRESDDGVMTRGDSMGSWVLLLRGRENPDHGAATGNESLKAEGKDDQGQAKAKEAGRHVKEAAKNTKDTLKP